jgi:DNA polymerase (family 10)
VARYRGAERSLDERLAAPADPGRARRRRGAERRRAEEEVGWPAVEERVITNEEVAGRLEEVAGLLEAQEADGYRVRAYRAGAGEVRGLERPVAEIVEQEGRDGLESLPHVGHGLARMIEELVRRGRLAMLERLRGEAAPEDVFASLPGIGEVLARRIHEELGVDTLEELEVAAHDGRLARVRGLGKRRAEALREVLAGRLGRKRGSGSSARERPPVELLLEVDRAYREAAARGKLEKIAPRRLNPSKEAWLPVMHVVRGGWDFTALFSNTALAHRQGKTHDWVVLYWSKDGHEGQSTVVTRASGSNAGRRVVRGRENE